MKIFVFRPNWVEFLLPSKSLHYQTKAKKAGMFSLGSWRNLFEWLLVPAMKDRLLKTSEQPVVLHCRTQLHY